MSNTRYSWQFLIWQFFTLAISIFLWSTITSAEESFRNPIFKGADPWVVKDPNADRYLWCKSNNDLGIIVSESHTITSFGTPTVVWNAPSTGPYSKEVWAPELHWLDDRWYIYFAASDGDNKNHLTYVLASESTDPLGSYTLFGPLATGEGQDRNSPNIWAIDMTVLKHSSGRYAIWSGWDAPGTDRQFLYIAKMKSPTELEGPRVRICDHAEYLWEHTEETIHSRGLAEGPEVLQHQERTFVTYSTAASWLPTYKLGMLELVGSDPLDSKAWHKFPEPVFAATDDVYGVGHSCFVNIPGAKHPWWHIYHAKLERTPGWNRGVFVQPFDFDEHGLPQFGKPLSKDSNIPKP